MKRNNINMTGGILPIVLTIVLTIAGAPAAHAATPLNAILTVDDPAGNLGGARVRVVHASPDAPAVDVWVAGGLVFENIAFEQATDFVEVPAGTYNVQVVPSGATSPVVIEADLDLAAATDYTVVATDFLNLISPSILTADGGTPDDGEAWVRFFHASPDAPAVDIAVTNGPVLLDNVSFQTGTNYIPVPATTYDLEARLAGTETVVLSLPGTTVEDGGVYTAYATGLVADIQDLDEFYFVAAAARAGGDVGSFFLTDLEVQNMGDDMASFQFLWLPRNTDNATPAGSELYMVESQSSVRMADILGTAFGVSDGTDAVGALAIVADSADLRIFSRTYNQTDEGTFGQAFPGLAAADLIPANDKRRIVFFTENADYRSNIGILNGTGAPMTIMWQRFISDGTLVETSSAELPAWGNTQLDKVFAAEAPVVGGFIDVWTETTGAAFTAYGSVLDNVTSDPVTVLPY